ncbi:hypothetical protein Leryth_018606 [Lithospermum erythrorhizon]|nr:hypothetical protein Leryth_018606 [Lithospermum erythrorhizon]
MSNQTMKKLCTTKDTDLISALPDNLIDTILIELPLRDAARTCILSRRWRYSWVKLSHLKLDYAFWLHSLQNASQARAAKFAIILFRILLLHQGPITSISLHIPELESPPEIDTLINFIVRNGVQKCILDMFPKYYKLHSSLFTCPTLIELDLRACEINFVPSTSERFSNLTSLTLNDITVSARALHCLLSSCPFLYTLKLNVQVDIQCLQINAPKLVYFAYYCSNSSQSSLAVNYIRRQQAIVKILGGFPDLKSLFLDSHCVKSLAAGDLHTRLPISMLQLIDLLDICLEDVDQFSSVLCLIRSSPGLKKFKVSHTRHIGNHNNDIENFQEEEDYSDVTLNHLEEVKILGVVGGRLELKLIRILFAKSPSLRKMSIRLSSNTSITVMMISNCHNYIESVFFHC